LPNELPKPACCEEAISDVNPFGVKIPINVVLTKDVVLPSALPTT
jgi:hypothetical protein